MNAPPKEYRSWMTAITFAEAGEWETARQMMPPARPKNAISAWQRAFMAVTFAEAGLPDEALRIMDGKQQAEKTVGIRNFVKTVGLEEVRVRYGVLDLRAE